MDERENIVIGCSCGRYQHRKPLPRTNIGKKNEKDILRAKSSAFSFPITSLELRLIRCGSLFSDAPNDDPKRKFSKSEKDAVQASNSRQFRFIKDIQKINDIKSCKIYAIIFKTSYRHALATGLSFTNGGGLTNAGWVQISAGGGGAAESSFFFTSDCGAEVAVVLPEVD
jgi:hypothetical protein